MSGFLSCPACGTSNIPLGAPGCPGCRVAFAAPVVPPQFQPAMSAVATAPSPRTSVPPPQPQPGFADVPASDVAYASIWRRMAAAIIDAVIVMVPFLLLVGPTTYFGGEDGGWYVRTDPWEYLEMLTFLVYAAAMQSSSRQATLGMQALGLRIVREGNHAPVSFARAAGRHLLTFLSAALLMIGYLMIAFTEKRQGLHDMLARTVVVRDPR